MNELQAKLGPLPLWGWLVAGVALGGAALLFWRRQGTKGPGSALGQSSSAGAQPNYNYSPIDPLTNVPYSVESQTNPNTGLPNYYNTPPGTTPPPAQVTVQDAWNAASSQGGSPPDWFVQWWNSGHQGPPPIPVTHTLPPGAGQPGVGLTPIGPSGGVNPPPPSLYPQQPVGWPKTAGY